MYKCSDLFYDQNLHLDVYKCSISYDPVMEVQEKLLVYFSQDRIIVNLEPEISRKYYFRYPYYSDFKNLVSNIIEIMLDKENSYHKSYEGICFQKNQIKKSSANLTMKNAEIAINAIKSIYLLEKEKNPDLNINQNSLFYSTIWNDRKSIMIFHSDFNENPEREQKRIISLNDIRVV